MHPSAAPSLQIVFLVADAFAEVSTTVVRAGWQRWIGPHRFERKLKQMTRFGWVQTKPTCGKLERVICLTEFGRLVAMGGRDPEASWARPWDGRWRLALFDIPERRRALRLALRRRLARIGFGYLQNSVWISPDSCDALRELVKDLGSEAEAFSFMEARPCAGESDADLVRGAWNFEGINRNYELYLDVLRSAPARVNALASRRSWLEVEWKAWSRAVRCDPLLPESLLPEGYRGREAWHRRCETLRHLVKPN